MGRRGRVGGRLSRVIGREGEDPKVSGNFYKEMDQAVLLFGAETWVLTLRMERALESFQHRVARRITRKQPRKRVDGRWEYPPLEEALGEAGFKRDKEVGHKEA